jgi:hypothetical protein
MLTLSNNATAVYNSSSGKFVYTLAASQDTADLKVNGYSGSITDAAGNALVKLASVSLTMLMPRATCADASGLSAGPLRTPPRMTRSMIAIESAQRYAAGQLLETCPQIDEF